MAVRQVGDRVEAEIARELSAVWARVNAELFGGRLSPCPIEVTVMAPLGRWRRSPRGIALSWALVLDRPWLGVIEVLKHEMAHQFVDEALGVRDETAHGVTFRAVCRDRGIDARAAEAPDAPDEVTGRIRKLLALSESPNVHEAEAAMAAAMRVLRRHGLQLDDVAAEAAGYRTAQIGQVRARIPKHEQLLAGLIAEHLGVRAVWVPAWDPVRGARGKVLEIVGSGDAIELAIHTHAVVLDAAERAWRAWQRAHRVSSDAERRRFFEGVVIGVREAMLSEERSLQQEGLVLVRDARLDDWFGRRHPRLVRRSVRVRTDGAHAAGREAGASLEIHRPLRDKGGARKALPGDRAPRG